MNEKDRQELKDILEDTARESGLRVSGQIAELKSPEVKQAEKEVEDWKKTKTKYNEVNEFKIPQELLRVLIETDRHSGLIFSGEGGIGKTILTISFIKKILKPNEWAYSNGYTTPLALYEFLYSNRNKKIVILDDVEGIFNNRLALSILKGALWESDNKRICQYSSKSDKIKFPQNFIMNAKVIILCNSIPKENDISTRAMISRTIPYKISFNFKQKMKICKKFIEKDNSIKNKKKVIELLENNITLATKDFNFRTLKKIIAFVEYDEKKSDELLKATTETDEVKDAYIRAVRTEDKVKSQIILFTELCGRGRRTFFRVKKSINDDIMTLSKDMVSKIQTDVRGCGKNG